MWLPWQQGMIYAFYFDIKISSKVYMLGKVSGENLSPFQRYLSDTTKAGEYRQPPPPPPPKAYKVEGVKCQKINNSAVLIP